jgi:REase_DpnII-MboI
MAKLLPISNASDDFLLPPNREIARPFGDDSALEFRGHAGAHRQNEVVSMSHADEMLFQDAKAAFLREITAVKGQNGLDEAFAAWLLHMHDGGMTVEAPARAAAAHIGAERSYRDVAVLGFASASNTIDPSQRDALSIGLTWLSGRKPFVGASPAPFCTDAIALLGIALGAKCLGDDSLKRTIADCMGKFLAQCYDFRGIQEWQKCLFAAAQRAVEAVPILRVPENASVADVRVALCAKGLLPMPGRAQRELDEIEALSLLKQEVDIRIGAARAALRLAAFEWVTRSAPVATLNRPTIDEVSSLLRRVPVALRKWSWEEKPRTSGRGAQARKWHIDNEYHVQNILWLLLAPIFPDLKDEEYTPSVGQLHPRADLCLPSLKSIIEVKFIRPRTAFKEIIEEVAADASLYLTEASIYDSIIAFVWDDSRRSEQHDTLVDSLRQMKGIVDAIVVSRPGRINESY